MSPPIVVASLAFAALGLAVSSVSRALVWSVVRHRPEGEPRDDEVSILKPLCGIDASLSENLQAFSQQSHHNLNIIFGVADAFDEALPVAQRFCREHQAVPTRISIGETPCYNPKVALLARMSGLSSGEWVVVSDSNVRVTDAYVRDALSHATEDVGLVTHLVSGCGGSTVSAYLENLQLNCFVAAGVCGVRFIVGQTCVIGKSMFLRREVLESIGGFEAAGGYLAEDYVIGRAVHKAGHRVVTAKMPVPTWNEGWTFTRFVRRHLRWAVMRRQVSRLAYAMEIFLTPGPLLMLVLLLALWFPEIDVDPRWLAGWLAFDQALDYITYSRMTGKPAPLVAVLLNPLRQWLTLAIWALGWFVQTVEWRGKTYRVGSGSRLRPLTPISAASTTSIPR
ncbi:MAG TPA: glycosyltransferase [Polyangiaceae bacterium]|nr:glycosyltransferase [Polyangiaceae bacterium]